MSQQRREPKIPEPRAIHLDRATSGIAVLDLSVRCDDDQQACARLLETVRNFLDRARAARVPLVFTASRRDQGTPAGRVATALKHREDEPLIFPDAFDKFASGELHGFLSAHHVRDLVIVGSATNVAVMYTATTAARVHRYSVIIPVDGVNTAGPYEHEYALHQLSVLPGTMLPAVQFTTLSTIEFSKT